MLRLKICPPIVRLAVAAGLYLLVMWGYMALPSGQWFAAFLALLMSAMLIFWVSESAADAKATPESLARSAAGLAPGQESGLQQSQSEPSLDATVMRLDSLKSELAAEYAQFGKDQSLINSNALGSWHRTRNPQNR